MTPLHESESTGPSSAPAPGPGTAVAKRARGDRRGRAPPLPTRSRRRGDATTRGGGGGHKMTNLAVAVAGCLLLPRFSAAARQQQQQQEEPRRWLNLMDGVTSCAGCEGDDFVCSGRTIEDENCAPCVTGQTWWPCNIVDECYCKDVAAAAAAEAAAALAKEEAKLANKCDMPLCQPGETGPRLVPFSDCEEYVNCDAGTPGQVQRCSPGMFFSVPIQACNVLSMVTCPPDPTCPPSKSPMAAPTTPAPSDGPTVLTPIPTTPPVADEAAEPSDGAIGGDVDPPGDPVGDSTGPAEAPAPVERAAESTGPDPAVLEGMYVMDAHVAANKIAIARELLTSPGGGRGGMNDFSYLGFRDSLRSMITVGAANRTFYVGHAAPSGNGRAYGLVNVAAFLAMSAEDSIAHGSCDEVNRDVVGGLLPISNACGQGGRDYQAMTCPPGEEAYQCAADPEMRARANEVDAGRGGGGGRGAPSKPFYCGPTSDYDGYTGHWDYVSGMESPHPPVENGSGRRDVEGCCWWGRGSIQLRGLCAYGKLNYFLGKRAHDEGRPSMFPDIDFCANPQAVCSHPDYPDLKWIAGMFRWITEVQPYNGGDFNYMQRLMGFVDGGLRDWTFVHGLSGIVTQGCHDPPCAAGTEFEDGARRMATFIRTLRLLGLSPGKEGTTAHAAAAPAAGGRRLGESSGR